MIQNSKEYEKWFIRVGRFRMECCRLLPPGVQLDWDRGVAGEETLCLRSKLCHLQILYVCVSGNVLRNPFVQMVSTVRVSQRD